MKNIEFGYIKYEVKGGWIYFTHSVGIDFFACVKWGCNFFQINFPNSPSPTRIKWPLPNYMLYLAMIECAIIRLLYVSPCGIT